MVFDYLSLADVTNALIEFVYTPPHTTTSPFVKHEPTSPPTQPTPADSVLPSATPSRPGARARRLPRRFDDYERRRFMFMDYITYRDVPEIIAEHMMLQDLTYGRMVRRIPFQYITESPVSSRRECPGCWR